MIWTPDKEIITPPRQAFCYYGDYPRPIIPIGPGRCGTSFVAKCLSEMDIFMGYKLKKGDKWSPDGYYEDKEFLELTASYEHKSKEAWHEKLSRLIRQRRNLNIPWGFKDPAMCTLLQEYLKQLNPIFIRLRRDKESCIASFVKRGVNQPKALNLYKDREEALDKYLKGHSILRVTCPSGLKDKTELKNLIRRYLLNCGIKLSN